MKSKFHREITCKALGEFFSDDAMQIILAANLKQDRIKYQFGHHHFHFDNNSFDSGFAYIDQQENLLLDSIAQGRYRQAWEALGRITHTWQDFYSHSNYIRLWISDHPNASPEDIDPDDPHFLHHPLLESGKVYGLMEFIAMIPGISRIITPLMPADSHAKMNLDSPASGALFIFNYHAGLKRSFQEYKRILDLCSAHQITPSQINQFRDKFQEEEKV